MGNGGLRLLLKGNVRLFLYRLCGIVLGSKWVLVILMILMMRMIVTMDIIIGTDLLKKYCFKAGDAVGIIDIAKLRGNSYKNVCMQFMLDIALPLLELYLSIFLSSKLLFAKHTLH